MKRALQTKTGERLKKLRSRNPSRKKHNYPTIKSLVAASNRRKHRSVIRQMEALNPNSPLRSC